MRDIFGGASKMHESLTFLGAVGRAHPSSASGLPLPVAVAAQRILGTEADLFGKTVVVPRAGNGAILAHLPHGVTLRTHEPDARSEEPTSELPSLLRHSY